MIFVEPFDGLNLIIASESWSRLCRAALQVALEVRSYLLHLSLVATGAGHDDAMWRLN